MRFKGLGLPPRTNGENPIFVFLQFFNLKFYEQDKKIFIAHVFKEINDGKKFAELNHD